MYSGGVFLTFKLSIECGGKGRSCHRSLQSNDIVIIGLQLL